MLNTPAVFNKVRHVAKKIERRCACHVTIFVALASSLDDTEFEYLISDGHYYGFDLEIDVRLNRYIRCQLEYLNAWLAAYNAKHDTMFTLLGVDDVLD